MRQRVQMRDERDYSNCTNIIQLKYNWSYTNMSPTGLCIFKCTNPDPIPDDALIHISKAENFLQDNNDHCSFEKGSINEHMFRGKNDHSTKIKGYIKYGLKAISDFDEELVQSTKNDINQIPNWPELRRDAYDKSWFKEWMNLFKSASLLLKTDFIPLLNQFDKLQQSIEYIDKNPINTHSIFGDFINVSSRTESRQNQIKEKAMAKAGIEFAYFLEEKNIDISRLTGENQLLLFNFLRSNQDIVDDETLIEIFSD